MTFQDFDQISQRRKQESQQKIRRRITIAVASIGVILWAAAAVCAVMYEKNQDSSSNQNHGTHSTPKQVNTAEKAVNSACTCRDGLQANLRNSLLKALKNNATIQPKDILKASFVVASEEIDKVIKQASILKFNDPRKKAAFDDCFVLLNDAKEELNSSISCINGGKDLTKLSSRTPDINHWLSAVLSYQQTGIDGFPEGEEKAKFQNLLKITKELSSNALAFVSQSSSISSMSHVPDVKRNLLAVDNHKFPSWINQNRRRMLKADATKSSPNLTVVKDGSGNFTTVSAALNAIPPKYTGRYVIYVKEGVCQENVIVTKNMVNVTMYGDGSQKSIITGSKNFVDGVPTF